MTLNHKKLLAIWFKQLNNDDKELQIKLAQLQTDVQIYLTISVSIMAVFFALIISFQQLAAQAIETWSAYIYLTGMTISVILAVIFTWFSTSKMKEKQKEMDELKKKYVW